MIAFTAYTLVAVLALGAASKWIRRLRFAEVVALWALPLIVTGPALLRGRVFAPIDQYSYFSPSQDLGDRVTGARPKNYQFDVFTKFIPWRTAAREQIAQGSLPLWNPHMQCGDPLLGASEPALLHPVILISLLLPIAAGLSFVPTVTLLLAAVSAYMLFRTVARRREAAYLAAAAWMLSSYGLFWLQYPVGLTSATLPLTALAYLRLARRPSGRRFGLAIAATALHLLGGHPESALYCISAAGLVALLRVRTPLLRELLNFALRLVLVGLAAVALSAAALLPAIDTARQSEEHAFRAGAYAHERRSVDSRTAWRRWAPNLVPFVYGTQGVEERADKPAFVPPASAYCGSLCLMLSAIGAFGRRFRGLRFAAIGLVILGTAIAAKAPVVTDWVARLPLFDISIPEYFTVWGSFGLCILLAVAGTGLSPRRAWAGGVSAAALGVQILALAMAVGGMKSGGLSVGFIESSSLAFLVPAFIGLVVVTSHLKSVWRIRALITLLVVQRLWEVGPLSASFPPEALSKFSDEVAALKADQVPGRIVGTGDRLMPNAITLAGLEDPRGYSALTLREYAETFPLWSQGGYPIRNRIEALRSPFLSMMNVRLAVVGRNDPVPPGWIAREPLGENRLQENPGALPRAFAPRRVLLCGDRKELLARLAAEADFAERAYLETRDPVSPVDCREVGNSSGSVSAHVVAGGLDIDSNLSAPGWIFVSQTAWDGWKAIADGAALVVVRANGAFLAIYAPEGPERISLRFRPESAAIGSAISLATLFAAAIVTWIRRARVRPEVTA
ncbi:MAG: hypothetical protein U0X73_11175 [Thermoanaerobaculia bacterium]